MDGLTVPPLFTSHSHADTRVSCQRTPSGPAGRKNAPSPNVPPWSPSVRSLPAASTPPAMTRWPRVAGDGQDAGDGFVRGPGRNRNVERAEGGKQAAILAKVAELHGHGWRGERD